MYVCCCSKYSAEMLHVQQGRFLQRGHALLKDVCKGICSMMQEFNDKHLQSLFSFPRTAVRRSLWVREEAKLLRMWEEDGQLLLFTLKRAYYWYQSKMTNGRLLHNHERAKLKMTNGRFTTIQGQSSWQEKQPECFPKSGK